jgi:hypothetical protein
MTEPQKTTVSDPAAPRGQETEIRSAANALLSSDYPLRDLLQDDSDTESLRERLRLELAREMARHPDELAPGNRQLVYALYNRLLGPDFLEEDELLRFLRAAAFVLCQELCTRADEHSTIAHGQDKASTLPAGPLPSSHETELPSSSIMADAAPDLILARERRRQELARSPDADQRWLAELYALADYAGRSAEELADLFDRPVLEIRTELALGDALVRGVTPPSAQP